ncbi:adenylate kinase [Streptomyces sp. NPDC087917]|uniref:adenylate kinase n=1 Tax=Streptomyces sp. NPDC087917 TaxID=3155060 RepID=UPI00341F74D0
MRRVLVLGISGAGKSTLARELERRLGLPFHELDALHFTGPGWAVNPAFAEDTARVAGADRWVLDGQGPEAMRDLMWERADTVVWLDLGRAVVMRRVVLRSLRRSLRRERLFGGNRESWREWLRADHPVWWAWARYADRRAEIGRRSGDPRYAPLRVVRLRSPREAEAWLRERLPHGTAPAAPDTPSCQDEGPSSPRT